VKILIVISNFNEENAILATIDDIKKYIPEFSLSFGEAVISAVNEKYRGKGIFKILNHYILNWFQQNTDFAEMGTYIANTPIHKTSCKNGLSMVRGTHQLSSLIY
jgi:hypothetical protein